MGTNPLRESKKIPRGDFALCERIFSKSLQILSQTAIEFTDYTKKTGLAKQSSGCL